METTEMVAGAANLAWNWHDLGSPSTNTIALAQLVGVTTIPKTGFVNVLAIGKDGNLWACQNDGTGIEPSDWTWVNLSLLSNAPTSCKAGFGITGGNPSVMILDNNNTLNMCYTYGGNAWTWTGSQGIPAGASSFTGFVSLTTVNGAITLLLTDSNNNLWSCTYVLYAGWPWLNLQQPLHEAVVSTPITTPQTTAGYSAMVNNLPTIFTLGSSGHLLECVQS